MSDNVKKSVALFKEIISEGNYGIYPVNEGRISDVLSQMSREDVVWELNRLYLVVSEEMRRALDAAVIAIYVMSALISIEGRDKDE